MSALRSRAVLVLLVTAVPFLIGATLASSGERDPAPLSPRAQYEATCASCHGVDGRGVPQPTVGFDVPLPDFTDCKFASREPDLDWEAVVRDGGPARAFDRRMPAFGEALSDAQIAATLEHAREFCDERSWWPRGELNLPRPLFTSKAFPEDEFVLSTAADLEGSGSVMNKLIYEQRLGARGQLELILPFGWLKPDGSESWTGGIGDIGLATKWALLHSVNTGSIFSAAFEVFLPTGREDRGLGKGQVILEPFLAFGQLLPGDAFVHLQVGAELATETDSRAHELFWRGVLGMSFSQGRAGRAWSPMVEFLGAREFEDDAKVNWDIAPQLQVTLSTRQQVMLGAGVRIPVNDFKARTTQIAAYLLWDWYDGSFFEGW